MSKETIQIVCEGCDSEYKVVFDPGTVDGLPDMCAFCGSPIALEGEERDVDDDDDDDEDDDWN